MKRNIQFIVNPFSGWSNKDRLREDIEIGLDNKLFDFIYTETECKGHAVELSRQAVANGADIVVACGGDGTVNEVAQSLVNTKAHLGILPAGSGNGFAMYTGWGRNYRKALKLLHNATPRAIDSCSVNGKFFLNLAGVGFDALIAFKAESETRRGFQMYLNMVSREMLKFKAQHFEVEIDNRLIEGNFTTIAVANAAMYGYNFTVAPTADLSDGLLDVVFIKDAPLLRTIGASWRLLNNSIDKSPLVTMERATHVKIKTNSPYFFHIDGESFTFEKELIFRINPLSINVLFPHTWSR